MKGRPEALEDADVMSALAEGWGINSTEMRYVPLGGGSYHWDVDAADGCRWFVSATDLDHAPWLGVDRSSSWRTLKATMSAAVTLRSEALAFVVAPAPRCDGGPAGLIRERYGLVVHPFLEGVTGRFGSPLHIETSDVIDMVVALHAAPSAVVDLHELIDLKVRETLDPADPRFTSIVHRYEELMERFADRRLVITHGEPHAGNVLRSGGATYLIDWDTAALALPERDLWLLLDHGHSDVLRLYEDRAGHTLDHDALALYRLRWKLEELIGVVRDLSAAAMESALADAQAAAGPLTTGLCRALPTTGLQRHPTGAATPSVLRQVPALFASERIADAHRCAAASGSATSTARCRFGRRHVARKG